MVRQFLIGCLFGALAIGAFLVSAHLSRDTGRLEAKPDAPAKADKCRFATVEKNPRKIVCDELVIKSKDGKHSITMMAGHNTVGMWIAGPKGRCLSLVSKEGPGATCSIGLHKDGETACSWAVSLDEKGNPYLQTIKDGKLKIEPVK